MKFSVARIDDDRIQRAAEILEQIQELFNEYGSLFEGTDIATKMGLGAIMYSYRGVSVVDDENDPIASAAVLGHSDLVKAALNELTTSIEERKSGGGEDLLDQMLQGLGRSSGSGKKSLSTSDMEA